MTRIARAFQHDCYVSRSTEGDGNTGNFGAQGVGLAHESPLLDDPPDLPPPDERPPELPLPELPLPELPLLELPLPEPEPDDPAEPPGEVDAVAGLALSLLESFLLSLLAEETDAAVSLAPERWSFLPSLP